MQIPQQPLPPQLKASDIYKNYHIDLKKLMKQLSYFASLQQPLIKKIIKECKRITTNEPNIIQLNDPVTLVGDIHGQLFDLLKIISLTQIVERNNMNKNIQKVVFLGDYVDRGYQSLQVITLLMALKIQFPNNVYMLRGNHQSRCMTQQYNFRQECLRTYNQSVYDLFMELFDSFPLACLVNKSYFCVHGGISDKSSTLARINSIQRMCQIPIAQVLFCDLIWSDPTDSLTGQQRNRVMYNQSRDCSIVFGAELANDFLKQNKLVSIIRAHQVFIEGYHLHKWSGESAVPPVITIFSAPNYCGVYNNKGAILKIQNNQMKLKQIKDHEPQKHQHLNFNAFSWTIDEVMSTVHLTMKHLTNSFIKKSARQLQKEHLYTKGQFLIKYFLKYKNKRPFKIQQSKVTKVQRTQQQERQYIFNRSVDYYSNSQKVHNKGEQ